MINRLQQNKPVWDDFDQQYATFNHERYAELLSFLRNCDYPSEYFELCREFVALRDSALALGMEVDPLPF